MKKLAIIILLSACSPSMEDTPGPDAGRIDCSDPMPCPEGYMCVENDTQICGGEGNCTHFGECVKE